MRIYVRTSRRTGVSAGQAGLLLLVVVVPLIASGYLVYGAA